MSRSLQSDNPTIISAFHTALFHQLLLLVLVVVVVAVAWNVLRTLQYRRAIAAGRAPTPPAPGTAAAPAAPAGRAPTPPAPGTAAAPAASATPVPATPATPAPATPATPAPAPAQPEPLGRRILRIGFGLLWMLDGLLQLQSGMVLGMPGTVLRPAGGGSPGWVQHLVNVGVTIWSNHPVPAAAATVWIQLGIGILLLVAPRGRWSRAAGVVSVGWSLVVWVFGEGLGSILAPGLTWAFGAPGAVAFYAVAGGLVALPDRAWLGRRLGRLLAAGMGVFFLGMALLQAWPGRGFWQGRIGHAPGTLAAMAGTMAKTPQPTFLSHWVSSFAAFDSAHGWGVNLFLVVALAAIGVGLCAGRRRPVLAATAAATVLCLAAWVLVEDLGFFGGVGTDPNSMVPMLLLVVSGAAALVRRPAGAVEPVGATEPVLLDPGAAGTRPAGTWWERLSPVYAGRVLAAVAAVAVVLVGAVPMAAASTNPHADPIIAEAVDGPPQQIDAPAPGFTLTDQRGAEVSLASLRGKVVALTFLDPVCTSDCPLIAQELRQADTMLGAQAGKVVFVAVVANPIYRTTTVVRAFDRQEGLTHVANWLYLTGPVATLRRVWDRYGIQADVTPAGSMIAHSELVYVIDPQGRERSVLGAAPGTGSASYSSFSSVLVSQIQSVAGT